MDEYDHSGDMVTRRDIYISCAISSHLLFYWKLSSFILIIELVKGQSRKSSVIVNGLLKQNEN